MQITPVKDWIAAAIDVMYEVAYVADEVVVVLIDGEVVDSFLV